MSAATAILVRSFPVGRRSCTMTFQTPNGLGLDGQKDRPDYGGAISDAALAQPSEDPGQLGGDTGQHPDQVVETNNETAPTSAIGAPFDREPG